MSEYQYYEFRAIDTPLTKDQKAYVSSLSSRAKVNSRTASFEYNYGDFRGDVKILMADYFDAMIYMANFGCRRLIFRIPDSLIDLEEVEKYSIRLGITVKKTPDHSYVISDIDYVDEDYGGDWLEGEGWLESLEGIREELIQGDFRVLYLAWLKIASYKNTELVEPPIPAGLGSLSHAQKKFVEFLEIDKDLIEVAAQNSGDLKEPESLEKWIEQLPASEQYDYLVRISRGESNLSVYLNRRLGELARKGRPQISHVDGMERRTIGAMMESSNIVREKRKEDERRKAEIKRQGELDVLYTKKSQLWKEAERLIGEKKIKSYTEAVEILKNLNELAIYKGELKEFREKVERIREGYSNCPSLLALLRESGLML